MDQCLEKKEKRMTVKLEVPEEIYHIIKSNAGKKNLTIKQYVILRTTDDRVGVEEIRGEISKAVPVYYNQVKKIGDRELQQFFMDFGGALCRF